MTDLSQKNASDYQKAWPKWPCLLVVGEPVTEEQAAEILIRTDRHAPDFSYAGNDQQLADELCRVFGCPTQDERDRSHTSSLIQAIDEELKKRDEIKQRFGILDLNFLHNNRIVSSYIGGPHGWCDWNGCIGTNNYNIGKWPEYEEVFADVVALAHSFPFLKMQIQLLDDEHTEVNAKPLVQFAINEQQITVDYNPQTKLCDSSDVDIEANIRALQYPARYRESGIDPAALKEKLDKLRA